VQAGDFVLCGSEHGTHVGGDGVAGAVCACGAAAGKGDGGQRKTGFCYWGFGCCRYGALDSFIS
jgi:hypothetical protein